jgi:hypothetical protein
MKILVFDDALPKIKIQILPFEMSFVVNDAFALSDYTIKR